MLRAFRAIRRNASGLRPGSGIRMLMLFTKRTGRSLAT
jgi:hypothetical protein